MNNTEYKGFTIRTFDHLRFHVMELDKGFRDDGYATLTAAKGAITKHIAAQSVAQDVQEAADAFGTPAVADALIDTSVRYGDVNFLKVDALPTMEQQTAQAITAVNKLAASKAVPLSRNKREGKFVGKAYGSHVRARLTAWCVYPAQIPASPWARIVSYTR